MNFLNIKKYLPLLASITAGLVLGILISNLLLKENGIFLNESHYLMDILDTVQYDSIYHEHLRFYSIKSMKRLMQYYKLNVYDVERIPNYGGSIRCYSQKGTSHVETDDMKKLETLVFVICVVPIIVLIIALRTMESVF